MQIADTIIISDIHLGTPNSRADKLLSVLKDWDFNRLIILGDLFDHNNITKLAPKHWEFLEFINRISLRKNVVCIEGNHDEEFHKFIPHLMNINVYSEYAWEYGGSSFVALHGHQFDNFLTKNKLLLKWAVIVYVKLQELDMQSFKVSKAVQKAASLFFSSSSKLAAQAISYGFKKGYKNVFCGHTHKADYISHENVNYYNSGCWTELPSSLISIDSNGIRLHSFH